MKALLFLLVLLTTVSYSQSRYDNSTKQNYTSTYVQRDFTLLKQETEKLESERKERCHNLIMKLKQLYNNAPNYPTTISDGFHNVEMTDDDMVVITLKVYVQDNKVRYMQTESSEKINTTYTSVIDKGKSLVKFDIPDTGFLNLYFIEDIYK